MNEWFYVKANKKKREKLMGMVMSPLRLSFGMTHPLCNMQLGSPCQLAEVEFRVVAEHISTRDLVQEYLTENFQLLVGGECRRKRKRGISMNLYDFLIGLNSKKALASPALNGWN
jgi:hypothetical protein